MIVFHTITYSRISINDYRCLKTVNGKSVHVPSKKSRQE